jgi:hypothetical protein
MPFNHCSLDFAMLSPSPEILRARETRSTWTFLRECGDVILSLRLPHMIICLVGEKRIKKEGVSLG